MNNPQYGDANVNVNFPYAVLNRMEQTGLYARIRWSGING
jgi:iron complex outermembrane receptor protein